MSKLVDSLIGNPDIARVLCIAIAAEAKKTDEPVDPKELAVVFGRLVRSLDRKAFVDECRKLERLGPERYLQTAGKLLR